MVLDSKDACSPQLLYHDPRENVAQKRVLEWMWKIPEVSVCASIRVSSLCSEEGLVVEMG